MLSRLARTGISALGGTPGGSYNPASSRRRQIIVTPWRRQARARFTAANPPSSTSTTRRWGNQRRTWRTICFTPSIAVWCARCRGADSGQPKTVRNGSALTRLFQGSGTRTIIATHFSPKHLTTTFREDRTASREQPLAWILRLWRRSTVSSATRTMGQSAGTRVRTIRMRLGARGHQAARLRTRWELVK